jgi:hypothetical protein
LRLGHFACFGSFYARICNLKLSGKTRAILIPSADS